MYLLFYYVCHNGGLEPILQPITNERLHHSTANTEDGARVDIKAQGFWENDSVFFIDVRVLNPPIALSYPPPATEDMSKKRKGLWSAHQISSMDFSHL